MDPALLTLIGVAGIGGFFLLAIFFLPLRKLPEEHGKKPLHTERCSTYWRALGGALVAGGNLPARISFYDDFFVIARMTLVKFRYDEIRSISFKRGWIFNSVTIHFEDGRSLLFHPKNIEKVRSLIEVNAHKGRKKS